jgi:ribose transport system permease protein
MSGGIVTSLPSGLVVLCIACSEITSGFATWGNVATILDEASIGTILACGLTFVVLQGMIDLSIEGVMAFTAVLVSLLVTNDQNHLHLGALGVIVAVVAGAAFGIANGLLCVKLRIPSLMTTLGTWFVGLGIAVVLMHGASPQVGDKGFSALALSKVLGVTRITWIAFAVLAVTYVLQVRTRFGRYSYAIGSDEQVVRLSGINVGRYKIAAFGLMGLLAGLAGVLATARLGAGTPDSATGELFSTIAAVVIGGTLMSGGRGGVLHSFVGVLIFAVVNNETILSGIDPYLQTALQGAVILVIVSAAAWPIRRRLQVAK